MRNFAIAKKIHYVYNTCFGVPLLFWCRHSTYDVFCQFGECFAVKKSFVQLKTFDHMVDFTLDSHILIYLKIRIYRILTQDDLQIYFFFYNTLIRNARIKRTKNSLNFCFYHFLILFLLKTVRFLFNIEIFWSNNPRRWRLSSCSENCWIFLFQLNLFSSLTSIYTMIGNLS